MNKLLSEIAYLNGVTPSRKPFWVQEVLSAPAVSAGSCEKFDFFPVAGLVPIKTLSKVFLLYLKKTPLEWNFHVL